MNYLKMYFHASTQCLLDNHVGVSRYDADAHDFIPVAPISKQEQRLLVYLMTHERELVTRDQLLLQVWPGRVISDSTINVSISRLRRKLQPIDPSGRSLQAVRNAGFIFSTHYAGLIPVSSLDFLLSSLLWSKHAHHQ